MPRGPWSNPQKAIRRCQTKQNDMKKRIVITATVLVMIAVLAVTGGSFYMLGFSLKPDPNRRNIDSTYTLLYSWLPDMRQWADSLRGAGLLRDTFVTMPGGERHHALWLRCDSARGRTAVIVHGYKDCAVKFLFLGRMYHRDLGCNILLPDLRSHGLSDGDGIGMGWNDRHDVLRWTELAERMFRDSVRESRVVLHGVSMGAATVMCASGEELPPYVKCFVEDCGYTSVWDEFEWQLGEQFGLPPFPLMYTTSLLCRMRYGWCFGEASPLGQVAKCSRPMLFIHGDKDTFVPTWMVYRLYEAKPAPKRLWIARGSGHAKAYMDHPEEYTRVVREFLLGVNGS